MNAATTAPPEGYILHPLGLRHRLLLTHHTRLHPDAASRLLRHTQRLPHAILVGATTCPATQQLSTSGLNRNHSRSFLRVTPLLAFLPIDTFDPNCLVLPIDLPLPAKLSPAWGNRLRRSGAQLFLAPGYYGTCPKPSL